MEQCLAILGFGSNRAEIYSKERFFGLRGVLFGSELAKTTEPCVKFLRERPFRARFEFSELYFTQQTGGLSRGITLREIPANRPGRELTSPRPE